MRINGFVLYCSLAVLLEVVLLIPGDDAYVKISVPTAFALISAAVKLKAVWLKAYMGLKSMGHRSHHHHLPPPSSYYAAREHFSTGRFKRSTGGSSEAGAKLTFNPDDLMNAWNELEKASQRKLKFDEASCAKASDVKNVNLSMWSQLLQSEFSAKLTDKEYSALVSSLIGSLAGDPRACQFTRIITASLMMKPEPVAVDFEEEPTGGSERR